MAEPGLYLAGLPVGVSFDGHGNVTLSVYAEDLGVALSEDGALPEHIDLAETRFKQRALRVELG